MDIVAEDLEVRKASIENDIPAMILIGSNEIVSNYFTDI